MTTTTEMSIGKARDIARSIYDPARPAIRDYADSGSFISQELPAIAAWHDLAPFLTLPGTCRVSFYCETTDVPDRVHLITADLDPAANRGYHQAQISLYGRIWLAGSTEGHWVHPCPSCGSPWCAEGDTGYGSTENCPDCAFSSYYDRGD